MPACLLFAQHGWADTHDRIADLTARVAPPEAMRIAPNLGYVRTWLRIEPLIADVETIATATLAQFPDLPVSVIGHSMGGLIWIEILSRHPEWWPRMTAFVLLGSPVDGSHYSRMADPMGLGVGIARDLGISRTDKAERLAQAMPMLSIAGAINCNGDHAVPLDATTFEGDTDVVVHGVDHPGLLDSPHVDAVARHFLARRTPRPLPPSPVIRTLRSVAGMTAGDRAKYCGARLELMFEDGHQLLTIDSRVTRSHVFLVDHEHHCRFAGYVGPIHRGDLWRAIATLREEYADRLLGPSP